ncbi:MAG: hypothetical protein ACYTDT_06715 [Planctomycetota bacterium]|jgi:hypothetical protein
MKKRMILVLTILMLIGSPLLADSKADLKPLNETANEAKPTPAPAANDSALRAELEREYRAEMEKRLEFEIKRHEDSLTNLWISNAVIWSVFLIFIAMQALSAKKRAAELVRLKAMKDD